MKQVGGRQVVRWQYRQVVSQYYWPSRQAGGWAAVGKHQVSE